MVGNCILGAFTVPGNMVFSLRSSMVLLLRSRGKGPVDSLRLRLRGIPPVGWLLVTQEIISRKGTIRMYLNWKVKEKEVSDILDKGGAFLKDLLRFEEQHLLAEKGDGHERG
jgi:hypothetical protein